MKESDSTDDSLSPVLVWLSVNSSWSHSSLALPLIHAAALESGAIAEWQWRQVSATIDQSPFSSAARVVADRPRVVAATMYLFNREVVLKVLRRIAGLLPDCIIIVGGPELLGDNRLFLESEKGVVHLALRGEGEQSLPRLLGCLDNPGQWPDVPGLCWLDRAGDYHDNGQAVVPDDDFLRLPVVTASSFYEFSRPFAAIETTRGCTGCCIYCVSGRLGPVRRLSLGQVREMLDRIEERGGREVRVLDRTFNEDDRRCLAMLGCFANEYPGMRFHLEIHPAFLSPPVRRALAAFPAGRLHIEAGLQTGQEPGLRQSQRAGSARQAWDGLDYLCGLDNLQTHVDLLVGLPHVSWAQTMEDLQKLIELEPTEIQLEVLKVLPGTALREQARQLGVVHAPDPPYEVLCTPSINAQELRRSRQISRLVDDFYNQPQLQPAIRSAVRSRGIEFLASLLPSLQGADGSYLTRALTSRYRLVHAAATSDAKLGEAKEMLEYQWLRAGHSPEHGIVPVSLWRASLPSRARLIEGEATASEQPGRIWQARIGRHDHWFVFVAGRRRRTAAAVYRARTGTA